jgi:hypothetical protein
MTDKFTLIDDHRGIEVSQTNVKFWIYDNEQILRPIKDVQYLKGRSCIESFIQHLDRTTHDKSHVQICIESKPNSKSIYNIVYCNITSDKTRVCEVIKRKSIQMSIGGKVGVASAIGVTGILGTAALVQRHHQRQKKETKEGKDVRQNTTNGTLNLNTDLRRLTIIVSNQAPFPNIVLSIEQKLKQYFNVTISTEKNRDTFNVFIQFIGTRVDGELSEKNQDSLILYARNQDFGGPIHFQKPNVLIFNYNDTGKIHELDMLIQNIYKFSLPKQEITIPIVIPETCGGFGLERLFSLNEIVNIEILENPSTYPAQYLVFCRRGGRTTAADLATLTKDYPKRIIIIVTTDDLKPISYKEKQLTVLQCNLEKRTLILDTKNEELFKRDITEILGHEIKRQFKSEYE